MHEQRYLCGPTSPLQLIVSIPRSQLLFSQFVDKPRPLLGISTSLQPAADSVIPVAETKKLKPIAGHSPLELIVNIPQSQLLFKRIADNPQPPLGTPLGDTPLPRATGHPPPPPLSPSLQLAAEKPELQVSQ